MQGNENARAAVELHGCHDGGVNTDALLTNAANLRLLVSGRGGRFLMPFQYTAFFSETPFGEQGCNESDFPSLTDPANQAGARQRSAYKLRLLRGAEPWNYHTDEFPRNPNYFSFALIPPDGLS